MRPRQIFARGVFAALLALALAACQHPANSPTATLTDITADYTGTATIYPSTPLDNLKSGLAVTAQYSNNTSKTLDPADYALSGTLAAGTSTVTVTYEGKTATFTVTVTADITYTAAQHGGADGTTDSTGITFTFTDSVDSLGLTAADITVGAAAAKSAAALSGTGASRTLAITVSAAGTATVTIAKSGIEAGTKHVQVFKAGQSAPTLTGITAAYTGTATIYPDTPLDSLKANLVVKAQYSNDSEDTLSQNEYALSGTLATGTSTVTVTYEGATATFTVTVAAAHAHQWGGWTVTTPATCTATGTETRTCSLDPTHTETQTISINPNAHAWGNWAVTTPVSETDDGMETRACNHNAAHEETRRYAYAFGTPGLAFTLISGGANDGTYRVRKGSVTSGAVYIPAWHHPNVNASTTTYPPINDPGYRRVTEIGSSTDTIGANATAAFSGAAITTVHFTPGSQLTAINQNAFYYCPITSIANIPATVTVIGTSAFKETRSLGTVTFETGSQLATIGQDAFQMAGYNNGLNIAIPAAVTTIGDYAFEYSGITSITLPAGVTAISGATFRSCARLTSVTIQGKVTTVGAAAFNTTYALTTVTFADPSGLQSIGQRAFYYCTGLTTNFDFLKNSPLQSIGSEAFIRCVKIPSITIPASVTTVSYAFHEWTDSQTIYVDRYASEAAADAGWGTAWRLNTCNAVRKYWNGSSYQ
ncbi:MAG: leucine-rich repeat protein [Treponema sp.]|nr:leucine-rich repeat protein [Treponema sp.]